MKYLYKILRITAWLLVVATIISLFSGYLSVKYFLLTGVDYRNLHISIIPWLFIPLFYLHSAIGLLNLLNRRKLTNKKWVKTIVEIIWAAVFVLLILIILAKPPILTPNNNGNGDNNNPSNSPIPQGQKLTLAEIAKHDKINDCWLIISNKVYNVTTYLIVHPGGSSVITPYCGKDGTQAFATKDIGRNHSTYAYNLLNNFYIGDINQVVNVP